MLTLSPARTICLGFVAFILAGTLLLMLPWATASGEWNTFLIALFTSTSAICVTGLVVVDTGSYYSFFGQAVICLLIQLGGLGYMTATTFLLLLVGKRLSFRDRLALKETLGGLGGIEVVRLLGRVAALTLGFEIIGALLMAPMMIDKMGLTVGLWFSVFHSVSAFNNAGFGLLVDNLIPFQNNFWLLAVLGFLVVAGGLGYQVWIELYQSLWTHEPGTLRWRRNFKTTKFSLHTRVVTLTSAILIVVGAIGIFLIEFNNPKTLGGLDTSRQLSNAIFHSISARTAGFNAVPLDGMQEADWFWLILLMLIGASPASTGGGLKTTTFAILVSNVFAVVGGKEDVMLLDRRLSAATIRKASAVLLGSTATMAFAVMGLTLTDPHISFVKLLFEVVSGFCTVGLSTGITAQISSGGQLILILTMYVGRVGFLLLAESLLTRKPAALYRQPEEPILIG